MGGPSRKRGRLEFVDEVNAERGPSRKRGRLEAVDEVYAEPAQEAMLPELDLFSPQALQNQVVRTFDKEFTPVSAITHLGPIEFYIPGLPMHYLNLSQHQFVLLLQILRADNTNPPPDAEVATINNPMHSIFSTVDVELKDNQVSDNNGLYTYRAYLEKLLSYRHDVLESQMQAEGFFKDTAGSMRVFRTTTGEATNKGLNAREALFREGRIVELAGRLHGDIFHQPHALISNVPMKIKLVPNRDNFIIVSRAPADGVPQEAYKMVIKEARLIIPAYEVSPSLSIAHEQILQTTNARYPIRRVTMKHLSIPTAQTQHAHDNIIAGPLPERIVIGLVSDVAMSGGYQQNPLNFEHFGCTQMALYVNGEMFPTRPYQPDFANGRYIRDYLSIFKGNGILYSDKSVGINRHEYANGYTIWVFDLSPDQVNMRSIAPHRTGNIRLEVKFAAPTTQTINIIVYAEYDSLIEIDKYRNVIAAYN